MKSVTHCAALGVGLVLCGTVLADTVVIPASKDNTLYEHAFGTLSNGAGQYLFAGTTATLLKRRLVIAFDVASAVPAGSTINSATLRLFMSRTIVGAMDMTLHRVSASWGEGTSDAFGEEGGGTSATSGDATWLHRFFSTVLWSTPGGDFAAGASATASVDGVGFYDWSSAQTAADVQAWLDAPASNFGWLIKGPEEVVSAKRFDSRENPDPMVQPRLIVDFTPPPPPCIGDYNGDLMVNFADITFVLVNFNNPFTFGDITTVLVNFGNTCGG